MAVATGANTKSSHNYMTEACNGSCQLSSSKLPVGLSTDASSSATRLLGSIADIPFLWRRPFTVFCNAVRCFDFASNSGEWVWVFDGRTIDTSTKCLVQT